MESVKLPVARLNGRLFVQIPEQMPSVLRKELCRMRYFGPCPEERGRCIALYSEEVFTSAVQEFAALSQEVRQTLRPIFFLYFRLDVPPVGVFEIPPVLLNLLDQEFDEMELRLEKGRLKLVVAK